ncbi:MAG: rRNA pseudouridine synthase [Spirochaetes bacterium]|nr:rRNA pseudouridine synthase [Spirochaetota bacterium]
MKNQKTERVHKLISRYGYASRRKAEELIREGRVRVDRAPVTKLGQRVAPDAVIEVDGRVINREMTRIYLVLNKPSGYLCTREDRFGRKTVSDLLPEEYKNAGVFNVGRLDYRSEGLLILTNDGDFAHRILHPSSGTIKKYEVTTDGNIPYNLIAHWKNGVYIRGENYRIVDFEKLGPKKTIISLKEGKKREIRNLFGHIGLGVVNLKRIAIGPLLLGDLIPGEYRQLTVDEIDMLLGRET